VELGKSKGQPDPRLVKVTRRSARLNFEEVYGISPEELRAKGIDPTKYAQEHSIGNPAFDRVMAASRSTAVAESRPRRRLSNNWFFRGVFAGIFVVGIGTAGFVTAVDRALVTRSWHYLGYAAFYLVLVLAYSALMWRAWRSRRRDR